MKSCVRDEEPALLRIQSCYTRTKYRMHTGMRRVMLCDCGRCCLVRYRDTYALGLCGVMRCMRLPTGWECPHYFAPILSRMERDNFLPLKRDPPLSAAQVAPGAVSDTVFELKDTSTGALVGFLSRYGFSRSPPGQVPILRLLRLHLSNFQRSQKTLVGMTSCRRWPEALPTNEHAKLCCDPLFMGCLAWPSNKR